MDNAELEALLFDVEADRVERKASLANTDRIREAICAFANDLPDHREPGVVFVGANDDGSCTELPITDQLDGSKEDAKELRDGCRHRSAR
jgi:ATP-dependent DNA helicase RecG